MCHNVALANDPVALLTKTHCTRAAHQTAMSVSVLFCCAYEFFQRPAINSGGEGGIRTPDRLAPMSDFESGAFNRALPPLRIVTFNLSAIYDRLVLDRFRCRTLSVRFSVPSVPASTSRSTADAW